MPTLPQQNSQRKTLMLNNIKATLEQGIELPNAYVEIAGYRYKEILAQETTKGADRIDGKLVSIDDVVEDEAQTGVTEITFYYNIWVSQSLKAQGKPSFHVREKTLILAEHPELDDQLDNFAEHATEHQKFEAVGDKFLYKVL